MEWIFWFIVLLIMYVYFGYPVLIRALSFCRQQDRREHEYFPTVTLIIAAHNEEEIIGEKVKNALSLDYPGNKLQIIVASDASTDRTNEIVTSYSLRGVELYDQKEHRGKSAALNFIIENIARGEVVCFNDATTFLEKDALRKIASYFSDDKVGAVTGKLIIKGKKDSKIVNIHVMYWSYEESLKKAEGKAGSLPFVSGPWYAIRKRLYTPVPGHLPDDSVSPLGVYKQGYRVLYAEDALAFETRADSPRGEFRIKARGVVRELASILHFKGLLNPIKFPMISFVLFSHRLLRWAVPAFLVALFTVNLGLLSSPAYRIFLWLQVSFYLLALCGTFIKQPVRIINLPFYFMLVNIAALWGVIRYISGQRQLTWKPVR